MKTFKRYKEKANDNPKPFIQPKLNVGQSGDTYENEADTIASKVIDNRALSEPFQKMEVPEDEVQQKPLAAGITPLIQKMENTEEETPVQKLEEEEPVQTKADESIEEEEPVQAKEEEESVQKMGEEEEPIQTKPDQQNPNQMSLESRLKHSSGGAQMDAKTRAEMEQKFGVDFSQIRIHTDSDAAQMSKDLGAQAFTHGHDIYFNKGKYDPRSIEGKQLLAHELTHTIQQKK